MKYTLAFSALLAATLLGASENDYEISAMAGYTLPNDGQYLDDYATYGVEMQFNSYEFALKPEVSVYYSDGDYKYDNGTTKILRTTLNGVYEFEKEFKTTPFFKIGVGYEAMSNTAFGNHDGLFADAGIGIKMDVTPQMAFKVEAIKMVKSNDGSHDNNLALMGGLTFTFGKKADERVATASESKPTAAIAPVVVAEKSVEKEVTKAVAVEQAVKEPFVAAAPQCPITANINDHFVFNSDHIDSTAASEIRAFAVFMKENPLYKATITGHADSIGTPEYNQQLSIERAEKVKEALVSQGIAPERLSTVGKGESMPIMSNMLKEGRAENRRIEIDLHK